MTTSSRPQMPPITDEAGMAALLAEQVIGVLCSHNPDGTIHAAPTYFLHEDGLYVMGAQEGSRRVGNLRRDPRATLLVERRDQPYRSVTVYGRAEVLPGDLERRIRILERVSPREEAEQFAGWLATEWGLIEIRLHPDRLVTVDYS